MRAFGRRNSYLFSSRNFIAARNFCLNGEEDYSFVSPRASFLQKGLLSCLQCVPTIDSYISRKRPRTLIPMNRVVSLIVVVFLSTAEANSEFAHPCNVMDMGLDDGCTKGNDCLELCRHGCRSFCIRNCEFFLQGTCGWATEGICFCSPKYSVERFAS